MVSKKNKWRKGWICIFLVLFYSLPGIPLFAQKITATLSRNTLLIGEQVTLQLKLENIDPQKTDILSWQPIADSINHLQVVATGPVDSTIANGSYEYSQQITLTSFDTGAWKFSPLSITLLQKENGKKVQIHADTLSLKVLPVDISGMQDYHDIKDILNVQAQPPYVKYGLLILAALLSLALIWILLKKWRKKKPKLPVTERKLPAFENALQQLEKLKKENTVSSLSLKNFYSRLTTICKVYSNEVLPVKTMYLTTDEMMVRLKPYLEKEDQRTTFFHLLRLADAIKFAKYVPVNPECEKAIATAEAFIRYVHNHHENSLT